MPELTTPMSNNGDHQTDRNRAAELLRRLQNIGARIRHRTVAADLRKLCTELEELMAHTGETDIPLCARWLPILTRSPLELATAIELIAVRAEHLGWPREIFIAKMNAAMKPGDEIVWLGYGTANIRSAEGETFSVYMRDS